MILLRIILLIFISGLQPSLAASISIEFLDDANFHASFVFGNTRFNGLSGIAYDDLLENYYIISDDRARFDKARFYSAKITTQAKLKVEPTKVVFLKNEDNAFYPRSTVDFEGITILGNENLLLSSEGNPKRGIPPALMEFTRKGAHVKSWPVPANFLDNEVSDSGVRPNLGPESLTITPDKQFIFTANEQALYQDGNLTGTNQETLVRIIKYNRQANILAQYGYRVDALPNPTARSSLTGRRGLVELLALDETNLLAMERSYVKTLNRNFIHLYHVDLAQASNISSVSSLANPSESVAFAKKKLILDFDQVIPLLNEDHRSLDNIEGMCFGPSLNDNTRLLVFVSDGNFNRSQRSQFLVFRFHEAP